MKNLKQTSVVGENELIIRAQNGDICLYNNGKIEKIGGDLHAGNRPVPDDSRRT